MNNFLPGIFIALICDTFATRKLSSSFYRTFEWKILFNDNLRWFEKVY